MALKKEEMFQPKSDATKIGVAKHLAQGYTIAETADKFGVNSRTVSRWKADDELVRSVMESQQKQIRRQVAGVVGGGLKKVAMNVIEAAQEDPELGLKLLKEVGALRTAGKDNDMDMGQQAEQGQSVTIHINLPEEPKTVDAVVENLESTGDNKHET